MERFANCGSPLGGSDFPVLPGWMAMYIPLRSTWSFQGWLLLHLPSNPVKDLRRGKDLTDCSTHPFHCHIRCFSAGRADGHAQGCGSQAERQITLRGLHFPFQSNSHFWHFSLLGSISWYRRGASAKPPVKWVSDGLIRMRHSFW